MLRQGGKTLFAYYGSLEEALIAAYPNYPWDPLAWAAGRGRVIYGWKHDEAFLSRLLDRAEEQIGIQQVIVKELSFY